MKKGEFGMAKRFSKKNRNKGRAFNYSVPAIRNTISSKYKLCQDTCQQLMIYPYITASRTKVNILLS